MDNAADEIAALIAKRDALAAEHEKIKQACGEVYYWTVIGVGGLQELTDLNVRIAELI